MTPDLPGAGDSNRALLVGIERPEDERDSASDLLDELDELVRTLDVAIASKVLVRLRAPQAALLVGSGKADEIIALAKEKGAGLIVFDTPLSPAQQRNWEKLSGLCVIDREEVILDIFARRAHTREARIQVGLARMQYSLPRLTRAWTHLSRQAGGIGGRGEGETQLEVDRRIVQRKIHFLKLELEHVRAARATQRKQRLRVPVPVCAIVGYTNAGKSSLLHAISGADVFIEDKPFATLDPTTRKVPLPNGTEILLSDTVGFIRRLPHHLVEAFKATLEEAKLADLLIHVIDATNPLAIDFHRTTVDVLRELGADQKPTVLAFNKIDLDPPHALLADIRRHFVHPLFISTKTGQGLPELLHSIATTLAPDIETVRLRIPVDRYQLVSRIHALGKVLATEHGAEFVAITASIPARHMETFRPYLAPQKAARRKSPPRASKSRRSRPKTA